MSEDSLIEENFFYGLFITATAFVPLAIGVYYFRDTFNEELIQLNSEIERSYAKARDFENQLISYIFYSPREELEPNGGLEEFLEEK